MRWADLLGPMARRQYGAVAQVRWRMLANSLRTQRGQFELGARIFGIGFFSVLSLAFGIGFAFLAWYLVKSQNFAVLALLLWLVLVVWQMLPVMLATFQENVELGMLLRFPVSFGSYSLLYLFFGLFDPSSLLGGMGLFGIWIGTVVARPHLIVWAALALALFAAFNLLLTRMIFAWIERWLAQRRTREVLGIFFFCLFLGLQLLNPAYHRTRHGSAMNRSSILPALRRAAPVQRFLPPGLAADAIKMAEHGQAGGAVAPLGGLALYAIGAGVLLGIRLRAEYRGENLGEAPHASGPDKRRRPAVVAGRTTVGQAANRSRRRADTGPVLGLMEKDIKYFSRSGVMLFSMFAPVILIFVMGGSDLGRHAATLRYALPLAVAYGFLPMTRQVCNSLGGEGAGIQIYFLSPTPFRTVMLAKNLLQIGLFGLELVLVCSIVVFRFGMPGPQIIAITFCWLLFALPMQLAAGNILSITMAYRMTLTRFSREKGATGNGLIALLVQAVIFGVGAAIYLPLAIAGHVGLAVTLLLLLAIGGFWAWFRVLANVDRMAADRREILMAELVRTN